MTRALLLLLLLLAARPLAASTCGNGIVEDDESCDDGNLFAGDCCSPTCKVEESRLGCAGQCLCDTCDDQLDNDEDGLTDSEDPECATLFRLQRVSLATDGGSLVSASPQPANAERARQVSLPMQNEEPSTLACLAGRPVAGATAPDPMADDQRRVAEAVLCSSATTIAKDDSAHIAVLPGAPLRELTVTAEQNELALSFDDTSSVLTIERLELQPATTLRLIGSADATVLIQITGALVLGRDARIELEGGLRPDHVLWNVAGEGREVTFDPGSKLMGTLLAPQRAVSIGADAQVGGAVYAARVDN